MQHFRSEGSADELSVSRVGDGLEHLCNSCTVLGIQIGIDLIEQVEWRGITSLNGENECESTKTYDRIVSMAWYTI
jgi:hypothetical protein